MLAKRIITSIFLLAVLIIFMYVDWLCGLMITAFIAAGLYEFFTMLDKKGIRVYKLFGLVLGIIIPLSIALRFELTRNWEFLLLVVALLFLITMQLRRSDNSGVVVEISTTIFGIVYVSWLLSFLIRVRYLPGGLGMLLSVLIITKLGDIGAYLVGSRFGKTRLIPKVSPNKSWEGSIAGLVFSVLGAFASKHFLGLSYFQLLWLGLGLGMLGQLGDLSESLIKRDCHVKDAGNILPGMGGVLDFIDSLLFTGPAFYFYMMIVLNRLVL